jgi:hypothetical protein
MAKKTIIAELTPSELAEKRAHDIKQKRADIKAMQTDLDALEDAQMTYMQSEGTTDLGGLKLVETAGKSKIGGLTGKAFTVAKERLLGMVEEIYIKKALDEAKITASVESDDALFGQLTKSGLKIEKSDPTYSLRETK